jgi:ribosomal protein S18 acetylase RimI-like enzyme
MLGTHPGRRRRGLGSQLIAPVLERCDGEGAAIHASRTNPRNGNFYDRHGFVPAGEFDLPHDGPRLWQIRRPPPAERQPVVAIRTTT